MCSINPTDHSLLTGLSKDQSGGLSSDLIQLRQLFSPAHPPPQQRNLSEGNNQSSADFLIQMQSTRASPLAMLPTTSPLSVSLVNKLQVNRAAQHFSDFIPLFLNTAQMWLAHQPDYLHKDSRRRRLPACFKSLEILLRLKKAFTGVRGGAAVVLERWGREKLHLHTLPLCVTPVAQRTVQSALSFITKVNIVLEAHQNALSWPRVPHFILCSQITFFPCVAGFLSALLDTCPASQTLILSVWTNRHLGVLGEHTPTLSEVFGFAEAQNLPFLDSVGWLWKHSTASAFPSGKWGGNLDRHMGVTVFIFPTLMDKHLNFQQPSPQLRVNRVCSLQTSIAKRTSISDPNSTEEESELLYVEESCTPSWEACSDHWVPWFIFHKGYECFSHTWI